MKKVPAGPARDDARVVEAIRNSPHGKVKVAVSDIDGVLRGKYLHKDKFLAAVEGGFGFCDVVFGWDSGDQCYDNTTLTGWGQRLPPHPGPAPRPPPPPARRGGGAARPPLAPSRPAPAPRARHGPGHGPGGT